MKQLGFSIIVVLFIAGCFDPRDLNYGSVKFSLMDFPTHVDVKSSELNPNVKLRAQWPSNYHHTEVFFKSAGLSPREYADFSKAWHDYWVTGVDMFSIDQIYDREQLRRLSVGRDIINIRPKSYQLVFLKQVPLSNGWTVTEEIRSVPINVQCQSMPQLRASEDKSGNRQLDIIQPKGRCNFSATKAQFTDDHGKMFYFDFFGHYEMDASNTDLTVTIEKVMQSRHSVF